MCVLRVSGETFEAAKYLALSGFEAVRVFHRGAPRLASNPDSTRNQRSGFTVSVSDASWESVRLPVEDAIAFLRDHGEAIKMLRAAPGVEDMRLDFPVQAYCPGGTGIVGGRRRW